MALLTGCVPLKTRTCVPRTRKGKVVDVLAERAEFVVRYQGGHNAGHTVICSGHRFILQLIPCGILRPGKQAVIGSGLVVDPAALVAEIVDLEKRGLKIAGRLFVSDRAHVVLPYHKLMDQALERLRGAASIGTTSRANARNTAISSVQGDRRSSSSRARPAASIAAQAMRTPSFDRCVMQPSILHACRRFLRHRSARGHASKAGAPAAHRSCSGRRRY